VIPGQPQHLIQRGNNRQPIFAAEADYQFFRDALVEASRRHGLAIHAYVWMTNHIHLLATPEFDDSISKVFQSVGRKYVQYFNFTCQRSGTLWEGRYRATVVDSERYLLTLMRYIELNPVRAGMVAAPQDYPWSSYRRNALGESGPNADWLTPHGEYTRLGLDDLARRERYRALFAAAIDPADLSQSAIARTRAGRWAGSGSSLRSRRWDRGGRRRRGWGGHGSAEVIENNRV